VIDRSQRPTTTWRFERSSADSLTLRRRSHDSDELLSVPWSEAERVDTMVVARPSLRRMLVGSAAGGLVGVAVVYLGATLAPATRSSPIAPPSVSSSSRRRSSASARSPARSRATSIATGIGRRHGVRQNRRLRKTTEGGRSGTRRGSRSPLRARRWPLAALDLTPLLAARRWAYPSVQGVRVRVADPDPNRPYFC